VALDVETTSPETISPQTRRRGTSFPSHQTPLAKRMVNLNLLLILPYFILEIHLQQPDKVLLDREFRFCMQSIHSELSPMACTTMGSRQDHNTQDTEYGSSVPIIQPFEVQGKDLHETIWHLISSMPRGHNKSNICLWQVHSPPAVYNVKHIKGASWP
jgi:hypothetical protein